MTTLIPLGVVGVILSVIFIALSAIFIARSQQGKRQLQEKMLDLVTTDTEYLISKFNQKDHRETIIKMEDDKYISISTDIQLFQLTTEGNLQLKISSKIDNTDIKAQIWTNINPQSVIETGENLIPFNTYVLFPFADNSTLEALEFFRDKYAVNYNLNKFEPCFALIYETVDVNKNWKSITFNGTFKDNSKWQILVNYDSFRMTFKGELESFQDLSNFPYFSF